MRDPRRYHADEHSSTAPMEGCGWCYQQLATCRKKIRFGSWQEADEWVREYNESHGYAEPSMVRYRCRWCAGWHMRTVRPERPRHKYLARRVERARRKWLIAQRKDSP